MKPRRYPSAYPHITWQRPTPEQAAEGILAIMIEAHTMPFRDGTRIPYERCGDIPPFLSVVTATESKG